MDQLLRRTATTEAQALSPALARLIEASRDCDDAERLRRCIAILATALPEIMIGVPAAAVVATAHDAIKGNWP